MRDIYVVSHRKKEPCAPVDENFTNLSKAAQDRYIYRIISLPRLFQLFSSRINVFVKPKKWDDPFENFILRSRIRFPSGELFRNADCDAVYGQCWTLQSASDAMWRIYSPQGDAVRIRSTPRRLAQSIIESSVVKPHTVRIGKVDYLSQHSLVQFARRSFMTRDLAYDAMAKSLLIKRLAFKHEREVRALLFTPARDSFEAGANLLQCPVNPHELIDQIMLDPRYSAEDADCVRTRIVEETNFGREILRSLLYAPPPRLVIDFAPPKVKRPPKLDIPTGWVQMVPTRKPSKKARKTPVFDVSEDV